jgi:glycyl-tRNA synthetase beta chain
MGRYYAEADQEPAEVALAIEEHYYPKQAGAALPSSKTGDIVALADKIDTIVGIFSAGLIPSGDKDPYALRRAALGLLRILVEHQRDVDVEQLVHVSIQQFSHEFDQQDTQAKVLNFITERFRGYCLSLGFTAEQFEAVLRVAPLRPAEFVLRLQAVQEFIRLPEADSLCAANKRIQNLLRKSGTAQLNGANQSLLIEPAEQQLLAALEKVSLQITPKIADHQYTSALRDLSELETPVNRFFEDILVMADDPSLREARLSLLQSLHNNFIKIADISVI